MVLDELDKVLLVTWNNWNTIDPDSISEEVLYFQDAGKFPLRLIFEPTFEKSATGINILGPR